MTSPAQQQICSRPFEWFEVHPDGSVFLCCPAWLKRPIGNLLQHSIEEIWNGPIAREIRKSIFNGSFHNCSSKRCPSLASNSAPVSFAHTVEDNRIKATMKSQNSHLAYLPSNLNLCFDYSCNLACPSCRGQIKQAQGEELQRAEKIKNIVLTELIPNAHSITLSGFGDPFGSPTYLALLKRLNRRDYPLLQEVRIHSNGQLLTEQMWHSLPDLQPLISEIEISIDAATEHTYRLNRPGGNFTQLQQNLEFLSSTSAKLTLSMVVQQNNWQEIPQLLALAQRCNAELYLSQLINWGTFSKEDFYQRAVHLSRHKNNREFRVLLSEIAKNTSIRLGNLSESTNPVQCHKREVSGIKR